MDSDSPDPLREVRIDTEPVFEGRLLRVRRDRVRMPDGRESIREYVLHPGAVVVIAELDNGKLLFERQFRYPLGRSFVELPAGKIDPHEEPAATAVRELREETGYEARQWDYLGVMHPCIGYSDERIEIYRARGLARMGDPALDHGEMLEVVELSLDEAVHRVRDGAITDAKTITALFWAEKMIRGAW